MHKNKKTEKGSVFLEIKDLIEKSNLNINKEQIKYNEPMKNHTTFKIGGPADCYIIVKTKEDVIYSINTNKPFIYSGSGLIFELVKKSDVPYIIVSSSGDYNLDDRETLLELAYKKHNKK